MRNAPPVALMRPLLGERLTAARLARALPRRRVSRADRRSRSRVAAATGATWQDLLEASEQQEQLIEALLTLARSQRGLDHREDLDLATIRAPHGTPSQRCDCGRCV